jgi:hypothetical protein
MWPCLDHHPPWCGGRGIRGCPVAGSYTRLRGTSTSSICEVFSRDNLNGFRENGCSETDKREQGLGCPARLPSLILTTLMKRPCSKARRYQRESRSVKWTLRSDRSCSVLLVGVLAIPSLRMCASMTATRYSPVLRLSFTCLILCHTVPPSDGVCASTVPPLYKATYVMLAASSTTP